MTQTATGATVFEHPLPATESVVAGRGSLERLAEVCENAGITRAVIVTGRTLDGSTPVIRRVEAVLGTRWAATFAGMGEHVPSRAADALVTMLAESGADGLVSVGGGSPIDGAKVAAYRRDGGATPHVAVPTTLSAAEFTSIAGVTDEESAVKGGVGARKLAPRAVVLDADLTIHTPPRLWLSTGIRALDHAVETIYAPEDDGYATALAAEAIRRLRVLLPVSMAVPDDVEVRQQLQLAAWLSAGGVGAVTMTPSHALGRLLGPLAGIGHGITSCITLAPSISWTARRHPERVSGLCEPFGAADAGAVAVKVRRLVEGLGLPATLAAAGVDEAAVARLLALVPAEWAEVVDAARS